MHDTKSHFTPDNWMKRVFRSQAVQDGSVIRRKLRDVERYAGRDVFLAEVRRRGFTAVLNGGQVVVFCNREPVQRLV